MFFRRTALTIAALFVSGGLCAFDVQYGSFFAVHDVSVEDGRPVLPLARGKYANVRMLDEETFFFVKNCSGNCRQPAVSADARIVEMRAAQTRADMWIADVSFGGQWLITFLIFKNPTGYRVIEPEHFSFLNDSLQQRVRQMLFARAAQEAAPKEQK
ncbi:hypothetical protein [Candidatus Avelusimicrobium gallicola]|uniref:Uncharacterized protein n=1 Tax=Candidatus Avelusimicrobium gallicola TaxID=2562704 RepID=A0A1Y4DCE7_9BACT|nr:hypothetical protein [Elusimicrobium sp. An273]OUO56545.1 hypothetical protein B5F75_04955 [Elusimicrobium sp. An273]